MNKIQSIFKMTCPRCREGNLFVKPFNISKPLDMHKACQVCGQKTEPEPGLLLWSHVHFLYLDRMVVPFYRRNDDDIF